jgi:hypothetical protein
MNYKFDIVSDTITPQGISSVVVVVIWAQVAQN